MDEINRMNYANTSALSDLSNIREECEPEETKMKPGVISKFNEVSFAVESKEEM